MIYNIVLYILLDYRSFNNQTERIIIENHSKCTNFALDNYQSVIKIKGFSIN